MKKLIKLVGFVAIIGLCFAVTTKADYWSQQYFHDSNLTVSTDYVEVSSACYMYGTLYRSDPYSSAWLTVRPLDQWGQPQEYTLSVMSTSDSSSEGYGWYESAATFEVKAQSSFSLLYGGYVDFNVSISW